MKKAALASVALLIGLALPVVLFEGGLRLFAPDDFLREPTTQWPWHRSDPIVSIGLQPGYDANGVRVNSLGFRGPPLARAKTAGALRIVCLGDSSTFGITLDEAGEETSSYPAFLRDQATERGRTDIEVVNAGVMGYTAAHGLRQLKTRVLPLAPDIVVARFGMNDHNWFFQWRRVAEPQNRLGRWLLYRFHDWRLGELAAFAYGNFDPFRPEIGTLAQQSIIAFERNLERLAEVGAANDLHLAFVDYPLRPRTRGEPGPAFRPGTIGAATLPEGYAIHAGFQRTLRAVAKRHGVPVIETAAALHALEEPAFTDFDLVHPSRAGKQRMAEVIYQALDQLGWLEPRSGATR